jgi:hypothetical protein
VDLRAAVRMLRHLLSAVLNCGVVVSSGLLAGLRFTPGSGRFTPLRRMQRVSCANAARRRLGAAEWVALGARTGRVGGVLLVAVPLAAGERACERLAGGLAAGAGAAEVAVGTLSGAAAAPEEEVPEPPPHATSDMHARTTAAHVSARTAQQGVLDGSSALVSQVGATGVGRWIFNIILRQQLRALRQCKAR